MLLVKFLRAPVGKVRCCVVVRPLVPGSPWAARAVCCPTSAGDWTLGVRTLSSVSSLSASRTSSRAEPLSGSRVLQEPVLRFRAASGARSMSGTAGSSGWYDSLAESGPVRLCEQYLMGVQQLAGCPWWLSIIVSTVMVRTLVTLPLAAYQVVIIAKVGDRGHESLV